MNANPTEAHRLVTRPAARLPSSSGVIRIILGLSVVLGCLAARPASAQLSEASRDRLADSILTLAGQLDASALPDRQATGEAFLRAAKAAEDFLRSNTPQANSDAWLEYLRLDKLRDAIGSEMSVAELGPIAVSQRERLVGLAPGLELPVLTRLRSTVDDLIASLRFTDPEAAVDQFERQLEALEKRVRELSRVPSPDDMAAIGAAVSVLREARQGPATVELWRGIFSQPNAVVTLSESFVQRSVNRAVDQTQPVRDCILGTRLVGIANLRGQVIADLRPSSGSALLSVQMSGNFSSNNRGYNGPVVLRTTGNGQVFVSRNLLLSQHGVALDAPHVDVTLSSQIHAIEHPLRIVRRIASKRAAQQKPQADRIAREKLRRQVGDQFAAETSQVQNQTPPDPLAPLRPWIGRLDLVEPTRYWGSTDDSLFIQSTLRRPDQLASVIGPPPVMSAYDIAVQVHETLVDNALSPLLSGRTIKQSQIEPLLWMVGRTSIEGLPQEIKPLTDISLEDIAKAVVDPEPPFEISFARFRPVIFEARDGVLRVGIRGTRFAKGDRVLDRPLEITADYRPARDPEGHMLLLRDGEVNVSFPGRGRLTVAQAALKGTIQKSFADVFPEVLADQAFLVPQDVPLESLRGRSYRASDIVIQDGWISLAVR